MNDTTSTESKQQSMQMKFYAVIAIIATVGVWISLWFLTEIALKYMHVKHQIITHLLLLAVSVYILHYVACKGIEL
jgi:hypothetical protein